MYRKVSNVPIFKDFPPICPYFLIGFIVGKREDGWVTKSKYLPLSFPEKF